MYVEVRNSFKGIMRVLETVNPFLVVLSIIGMFMDYTSLDAYVYTPNQIISILFVVDFAIRLLAHNPTRYFFKGYGWVDFIASLPGFMFFLENTPLFSIFKILRIGKFFKIIRILRFLRIFNFLKKMKTDSPWVQNRIMQVGVVVVLVFVSGIVTIDNRIGNYLNVTKENELLDSYNGSNKNIGKLLSRYNQIEYYTINKRIYFRDRSEITDSSDFVNEINSSGNGYISLGFVNSYFGLKEGIELPDTGIIYNRSDLDYFQNSIMLSLLSTLLLILVIMIFYMGFKFAKDVQIVQLVIDSLEAQDNLLLMQESDIYREDNGELVINDNDSELINLLKVATNSLPDNSLEDALMFGADIEVNGFDLTEVLEKIDELDNHIVSNNSEIIKETIRRVLPGILNYIDKHYK